MLFLVVFALIMVFGKRPFQRYALRKNRIKQVVYDNLTDVQFIAMENLFNGVMSVITVGLLLCGIAYLSILEIQLIYEHDIELFLQGSALLMLVIIGVSYYIGLVLIGGSIQYLAKFLYRYVAGKYVNLIMGLGEFIEMYRGVE